jgi:uncharacterized alpha-E superfamily protein
MILDPNNPRSLVYQLDRLKAYMSQLPFSRADNTLPEHEKLILEAHTLLKLSSKDKLSVYEKDSMMYGKLNDFLSEMQVLLNKIHDVVSKIYFKHILEQKQLFTLDSI